MKYLLQRGAKPNSTNDDSRTALHIACAKGFGAVARVLLANGVDVNGKVKIGSLRERQKVVVGISSCMPHAKIHAATSQVNKGIKLTSLLNADT